MNSTTTLADLAVTRPAAARVFYRHGLDFCCGGRRPIADVCAERGLDADAILADIDDEDRVKDDRRWDLEPLPTLIDFIVTTFHARLRATLPDLIRMAERVEARHGDKATCPHGLALHLAAVHESVLDHLVKEEQVLFPLIIAGQSRGTTGPILVLEHEHDDHARALRETRRLTNNLQPPPEACTTWQALYLGLQQFEQELMLHIHLENNVLFRRALGA